MYAHLYAHSMGVKVRTTFRSQFSLPTVWALEIELMSPGMASAFPITVASHLPYQDLTLWITLNHHPRTKDSAKPQSLLTLLTT